MNALLGNSKLTAMQGSAAPPRPPLRAAACALATPWWQTLQDASVRTKETPPRGSRGRSRLESSPASSAACRSHHQLRTASMLHPNRPGDTARCGVSLACQTCGYDMAGIVCACPECGRQHFLRSTSPAVPSRRRDSEVWLWALGLLSLQSGAALSLGSGLVANMLNGTSRPYYAAWTEAVVATCAVSVVGAFGVIYRGAHRKVVWLSTVIWLGVLATPTLCAFDWYVLRGGF